MGAFVIVLIIAGIGCLFGFIKRKVEDAQYRAENNGSRRVERLAWYKWSKILFDEYCQLAGIAIDFSDYKLTPFEDILTTPSWKTDDLMDLFGNNSICSRHGILQYKDGDNVFSSPRYNRKVLSRFGEEEYLSVLRKKYKLPSPEELRGTPYKYTPCDSLFGLMYLQVRKSVKEQGYKYGGVDFQKEEENYKKLKYTQNKYDWLE